MDLIRAGEGSSLEEHHMQSYRERGAPHSISPISALECVHDLVPPCLYRELVLPVADGDVVQ
jgi:hypothetical protein